MNDLLLNIRFSKETLYKQQTKGLYYIAKKLLTQQKNLPQVGESLRRLLMSFFVV